MLMTSKFLTQLVHMLNNFVIYKKFYCFAMYDELLRKKVRSNSTTMASAVEFLIKCKKDKRYSHVSDIFEDDLER